MKLKPLEAGGRGVLMVSVFVFVVVFCGFRMLVVRV
jgi:hypothetical protein